MYTTFLEFINEDIFSVDNTIKKYEKLLIDAIVSFMKEKFDFNATIIVKKKQNNKFFGDISLNYNSVNNNKFILHYNPNNGYKKIIKSIIHELTHIKQVSIGELKPTDDYKSIIWKNNNPISVREYNKLMKNYNEYIKLPWEQEAYNNSELLYVEFINSPYWKNLYDKDENLNFIIDNL